MKPFEFSEMYIFGKFDTFCKRLNQVRVTYFKSFVVYSLHYHSLFTYMVSKFGVQFSKVPKFFYTWKAVAKSQTL